MPCLVLHTESQYKHIEQMGKLHVSELILIGFETTSKCGFNSVGGKFDVFLFIYLCYFSAVQTAENHSCVNQVSRNQI